MKMWAGAINYTVQWHVTVAWCPFIAAVNFSSHLPSLSSVLHPSVLNMLLWDLFTTNSVVIIVIFLLSASRPSDALPVDAWPPQRRSHRLRPRKPCGDRQLPPCICGGRFGLGEDEPIPLENCGTLVFDFINSRGPGGNGHLSLASHPLVLH
jgi:hypothetical protein